MNMFSVLVNMELQKLAAVYDHELEVKKQQASNTAYDKVWSERKHKLNPFAPRETKDKYLSELHNHSSSASRDAKSKVENDYRRESDKSRAESKQKSLNNSAKLQMRWEREYESEPVVKKIIDSAIKQDGEDALKSSEPSWLR